VIGKISAPRGRRVEPLIRYLFGPGRREEHSDPHIVAGWRHPAELEPPLRANGSRDFRKLNVLCTCQVVRSSGPDQLERGSQSSVSR
jgi:hypothetical protein